MKQKLDENVIWVGDKPLFSYVTSVIMQFSRGNKIVYVKSRGLFNAKAIDVVEIVKRNVDLGSKIVIKEIATGSERFEGAVKGTVYVSSLIITLEIQK